MRKSVIDEIAAERQRQIAVEGWTAEHDDKHADGSLAQAAAAYAIASCTENPPLWVVIGHAEKSQEPEVRTYGRLKGAIKLIWPRSWSREWWKPKDRRRDLIRAAAMLVAEIERLDRAAARLNETESAE